MGSYRLQRLLLLCAGIWLVAVVLLPLGEVVRQSLADRQGRFVGLSNFAFYLRSPSLLATLLNSTAISLVVTVLVVPVAFLFAFALHRAVFPGKALFRTVIMAPLYAPTMLFGLSLIFLFGRQGMITTGFFGRYPALALDIGLYGRTGIVLGECLLAIPPAVLILSAALENMDARLLEAAASLGSNSWRTFWTVAVPAARYGLIHAAIAVFTLCFTDFGVPKVVGGQTPILATEVYKQVVGQQNFGLGAVISMMLLSPVLIATLLERHLATRQQALFNARSVPYIPKRAWLRDISFWTFCVGVSGAVVATLLVAAYGSLVRVWPYRLELGGWHYRFRETGGGGYQAFFNSLRLAAWTSVFGTPLTFGLAYLVEKTRGWDRFRRAVHGLALLPLALPGLVIGIAFIFFFNAPSLGYGVAVPNPFRGLYNTPALIVLSHIVHFLTVAYLTAMTALRQLDREFEAVSEAMGVSFVGTVFRVTVPICLPAIIEIALFFFVNAMASVSAVVFLRPPGYPIASVAVVNMEDAGDVAPAIAMCMLILGANLLVRGLGEGLRLMVRRRQRWKRA